MVDADASVTGEVVPEIVPEGIFVRLEAHRQMRVGVAEVGQSPMSGPALRLVEGVAHPVRRLVAILRHGDDVEVAGQHGRLLQLQQGCGMGV